MRADEAQAAIVAEAETWLKTPWHHEARVKGAGVDCAMLVAEVFHAVGLIPKVEIQHYPRDYMFHYYEEKILDQMRLYFDEITDGSRLPGDVMIVKYGHTFSHCAIVIAWPKVIHAFAVTKCVEYGSAEESPFRSKEKMFFRARYGDGV
ncbi:MAG: NlpC/P60 family protein [Syntrophaceae bacterium]